MFGLVLVDVGLHSFRIPDVAASPTAHGFLSIGLWRLKAGPSVISPRLCTHGFARLDFMLFPYGVSCVDSFLSALDFLHLEFFLSLRSSVRLGSVLLLYGIA